MADDWIRCPNCPGLVPPASIQDGKCYQCRHKYEIAALQARLAAEQSAERARQEEIVAAAKLLLCQITPWEPCRKCPVCRIKRAALGG